MDIALSNKVDVEASRLDVMNFLNEMASDFPDAISFVSGRPTEKIFDLGNWINGVHDFAQHYADRHGTDVGTAMRMLSQYGRTNGIINDLIALQVEKDERITCKGKQVLVTAGCQEAMDLCVKTFCRDPGDVLLVRSPTYIGITGAASLNDVEIAAFSCDREDEVLHALKEKVHGLELEGKCPKALYLVPEFDNPTGEVLSRQTRESIISFCASKRILILEDNPYGMFRFEGTRTLPMYVLDRHGCVVYLGTYSKTVCPTVRIGFAIVPEVLFDGAVSGGVLVDRLSQAKSFSAVNTSQINQAVIGGVLLAEECSLKRIVEPTLAIYRCNRDAMIEALSREFLGFDQQVTWNCPQGGFFLSVLLPFKFEHSEAQVCAEEYGVLVMPMSFFALDDGQNYRVRFAYSNVTPEQIREGMARFAAYVKYRIASVDAAFEVYCQ